MNIIRLTAIMAVYLLGMAVLGNCGPVAGGLCVAYCQSAYVACLAAAGGAGGAATGEDNIF